MHLKKLLMLGEALTRIPDTVENDDDDDHDDAKT